MIEVFTGKLGGGKSYTATRRIARQLGRGGLVVTNIAINWEAMVEFCTAEYGRAIEPEQLRIIPDELEEVEVETATGGRKKVLVSTVYRFHAWVPQGTQAAPVLVVIDEAHLYFNARDYSKTDRDGRSMLQYLTQSRKLGNDIILITQDYRNLDSQFVRLMQYLWRFRDLARFRIPGLGVPWISEWPVIGRFFPDFVSWQFDEDGKTVLQREFSRKDSRIFALYETNEILRPIDGMSGEHYEQRELAKTRRIPKIKMKWMLIFIVVAWLGTKKAFEVFAKPKDHAKEKPAAAANLHRELPRSIPQGYDLPGPEWIQKPGGWLERRVVVFAARRGYVQTEEGSFRVGEAVEIGEVLQADSSMVVLRGWEGEKYRLRLYRSRRRMDMEHVAPAAAPVNPGSKPKGLGFGAHRDDLGIGG